MSLSLTLFGTACRMLNPAFFDADGGSETDVGSSASSAPTSSSGASDSANISGGETGGSETGAGTSSSSGEESSSQESEGSSGDALTSSTGGDSSDSGGSSDTTGEGCPAPCDSDGECLEGEPPVVINCVNGCLEEHQCAGDELCVVLEGIATCSPPDGGACDQIESAYAQVVENPANYACSDDEECQAIAGSCAIPGGACWHVLNDSVDSGVLVGLAEAWAAEACEANCSCEGQEPPVVACQDNACAAQ